ncbi:MAG: helix-turn-helix transcriptional regulator, partial [Mycobacterium sp.]
MGNPEHAETEFRLRLRQGRETRKWTQAHLAELLRAKGFASTYPTTIAKLEAGERAARIDEIVAIAELFDVSLDTLLGHAAERGTDKDFLVSALAEVGLRSLWQITSTVTELRHAVTALDGFELSGTEKTVYDGCLQ